MTVFLLVCALIIRFAGGAVHESVRHSEAKKVFSEAFTKKFEYVLSLRSALWHELGDMVPDEGDFNVGYFERRQHTKKWLATRQDLDAMYS